MEECTANEKVYRFISDPGHKENLSGRVRAACLTCRRKKIKCSGEVNCRTCQEKGLVCEGLSERKKPRKANDPRRFSEIQLRNPTYSAFPSPSTATSSPVDDSRHGSMEGACSSTDPAEHMRALEALLQNEAVYNGSLGSIPIQSIDKRNRDYDRPCSYDSGYIGNDDSLVASPAAADSGDWSFFGQVHRNNSAMSTSISPCGRPESAIDLQSPTEWSGHAKPTAWANEPGTGAASVNLLSTAQALEQQAQNLRMLASQRNTGHAFSPPNRHSMGSLEPAGPHGYETYHMDSFHETLPFTDDRNVQCPYGTEETYWNNYAAPAPPMI